MCKIVELAHMKNKFMQSVLSVLHLSLALAKPFMKGYKLVPFRVDFAATSTLIFFTYKSEILTLSFKEKNDGNIERKH